MGQTDDRDDKDDDDAFGTSTIRSSSPLSTSPPRFGGQSGGYGRTAPLRSGSVGEEDAPQDAKERSRADQLQEEILDLEDQSIAGGKSVDTMKENLEKDRSILKSKQEQKTTFLKVLSQFFPGKSSSLGNFEEEMRIYEERIDRAERDILTKESEREALQKKVEQKKKELIQEQSAQAQSQSQKNEEADQENDSPIVPMGDARKHWGELSIEEKKKIFLVRNDLEKRVAEDPGTPFWEDLVDVFGAEDFGFLLDADQVRKVKQIKNKKDIVLFFVIMAHQMGKLEMLDAKVKG